jgi:hypothetical protein
MHPEKCKRKIPFHGGRVPQKTNPAHRRFVLTDEEAALATEFAF